MKTKEEPRPDTNLPEPPDGLQERGQQLWKSALTTIEIPDHELEILTEACRTLDLCDDLQHQIDEDGVLLAWGAGWRNHPAISELRQQRVVLARLLVVLKVPSDQQPQEGQQMPRRPRRGVYGVARKLY
jgi:hypothetical protein